MMIQRCENPNHIAYERYGKVGIKVCDGWHNPKVFIDWAIANGYSEDLTLDRKDNTLGYFPDNCRFLSREGQANNRMNNKMVKFNNEDFSAFKWSRKLGISRNAVLYRSNRNLPLDSNIIRKDAYKVDIAVFSFIKSNLNNNQATLTVETIANCTNTSYYSVYRSINRLISRGVIKKVNTKHKIPAYEILVDLNR
jgi:hypothetical protein